MIHENGNKYYIIVIAAAEFKNCTIS